MSNFSDYVFRQFELRASINTIGMAGSLMTKVDDSRRRNYVPLEQGTVGQILISNGESNRPIWQDNIPFEINSLSVDTIVGADFVPFYDISGTGNKKTTFANFEGTLSHDNLVSGTIVSHDTTATGAQLTSLTDNSVANTLHRHSELVASDGDPDPALSITEFGDSDFCDNDLTNIGEIVGPLHVSIEGAGIDTAGLGVELVQNGTFDTNLSGWTISDGGAEWVWDIGKARHVVANTSTFYQGVAVTDTKTYQVELTTSNRTAGSITLTFGAMYGTYLVPWQNGTYKYSFKAVATGTSNLTFTPSGTFDGRLDDITVREITSISSAVVLLEDSNGAVFTELRGGSTIYNTYFGFNAGQYTTSGQYNTAIGNVFFNNTTGNYNVAIGYNTLYNNTVGDANFAMGVSTMYSNIDGGYNVALGYNVLYSNINGNYNAGIGYQALYTNEDGIYNTAIGFRTMRYNVDGNYNVGIGPYALYTNDDGNLNVGIGYSALYSNTEGIGNVGIGYNTLYTGTTGDYSVAIGYNAGKNMTLGYYNIAIGFAAFFDMTEGHHNTAIGYDTGRGITTGNYNTIIGSQVAGLAAGLSNHIIIADGQGNIRMFVDNSGNHKYGDGGVTNYTQISATGDQTFHGSAGFYPRTLSQNGKPGAGVGATQIDSGEMLIWIDTDDGDKVYTVYNNAGIVVAALMAL